MPPAWQVRDAEQQKFVEDQVRKLYDAAENEEHPECVYREFGVTLLRYLNRGPLEIHSPHHHLALAQRLRDEFLAAAKNFARVESEVDALVCRMFRIAESSFFSGIQSIYERERYADPERALHASSPTAEIEFET